MSGPAAAIREAIDYLRTNAEARWLAIGDGQVPIEIDAQADDALEALSALLQFLSEHHSIGVHDGALIGDRCSICQRMSAWEPVWVRTTKVAP